MTGFTVPYNRFFALCDKAHREHGSIFDVPVDAGPVDYVAKMYRTRYGRGRVLDFGCGAQKLMQQHLRLPDELYHSCDDDPSATFTYVSPDEIPDDALYEIIAANQVFEHLTFEEGIRAAVTLARHVAPGGILQIGVPNTQHPTRQRCNPTHKTAWTYLNLCALLELGGLRVAHCARCNKRPRPRWYERPLVNMMSRVFRMDWCDTVYVVGTPGGPA